MSDRTWNADPDIARLYPAMPEPVEGDPWALVRDLMVAKRQAQTDRQEHITLFHHTDDLSDDLVDELLARVAMGWEHGPNARWWWIRRWTDGQLDITAYSRAGYHGPQEDAPAWRPTRDLDQARKLAERFVQDNRSAIWTFHGMMGIELGEITEAYSAEVKVQSGEVEHAVSLGASSLSRAICEVVVAMLTPRDMQ